MKHKHNKTIQILPLLALGAFAMAPARAAVSVYISAPNTQTAEGTNFGTPEGDTEAPTYIFSTETFTYDEGPFVPSTVASAHGGVYEITGGDVNIKDVTAYGGGVFNESAGTTNQENYLSVEKGGEVTITFDEAVNYFGFQWTAGNEGNTIKLYDENGVSLGHFNTGTVVDLLPNDAIKITAVDGVTEYTTSDYYGLPGERETTSDEPFAYLHFINDAEGSPISKIVISHPADGSGAFESDNHSVRVEAPVVGPDTELVKVVDIPEPSVSLLAALGCLALLRRKR